MTDNVYELTNNNRRINIAQLSVNKSDDVTRSGIIETDNIAVSSAMDADTIYCKKLVVTDELFIPVTNRSDSAQTLEIFQKLGRTDYKFVNRNIGKLQYDGTLRDLRTGSNAGDMDSVLNSNYTVTKNNRYKENIVLSGWSKNDKTDTTLYQRNGNQILLDEHAYYQGCGYVVGYNNSVNISNTNYEPIAYLSRIDYFVITIDSFSNIDSQPINIYDITLYDNIDADVRMNVVNKGGRYIFEVVTNSNAEVKWYVLLNLKKIYISPSTSRTQFDKLKYTSSDNIINWNPTYSGVNGIESIFKFVEDLKHVMISPFANKVIDASGTYPNSVIDDSIAVTTKNVTSVWDDATQRLIYNESINETELGFSSTAKEYDIYGYNSTFITQPDYVTTKALSTTFGHVYYMLNERKMINLEQQFGNTFTKDLTKDEYNFVTTQLVNGGGAYQDDYGDYKNTTAIKYVFQLKDKEDTYQPVLGIVYNRLFYAKRLNDKSESAAHREKIYRNSDIADISEDIKLQLFLFKHVGEFQAKLSKQIYMTQRDTGSDFTFDCDIGTHYFIKTYSSIRDVINNKQAFFTHYSSIMIPSYPRLRRFFIEQLENGGVTTLEEMQTKFNNFFFNNASIINDIDRQIDEDEGAGPETDMVYAEYTLKNTSKYINTGGHKYISNEGDDVPLVKYGLVITTETILDTANSNGVEINKIDSIQNAYNTFEVRFPIKVMCTAEYTSKYQTYILLETSKFKVETY